MKVRKGIVLASFFAFVAATLIGFKISGWRSAASKASPTQGAANRLVVHEWGTFTSIAGKDGVALEWRPLNSTSDLPAFVHTIEHLGDGLRHLGKRDLTAEIRMETPVIYFYSDRETDVAVKVDFPKGKITEWYPQARAVNAGLDWGRFKVMPGAALDLPVEHRESHYYPARETDAAPVQVCGLDGKPAQQEKFLFYRGVGNFALPISANLDGNNLILKNQSSAQIANLIVFENRDGKIGYSLVQPFSGELTIQRPALDGNLDAVLSYLLQSLVASGLYEKEAAAMIKTWRDSWFEPGLRLLYALPRQTTDAVLPLTVEPAPTELVRVLVGRGEVITPETEKAMQRQVNALGNPAQRQAALRAIRRYGRFSEPILKRVLANEQNQVARNRIEALIKENATTNGGSQ